MHSAEAEQLNTIRKESITLAHHTSLDHYGAWTFLCFGHTAPLDHYFPRFLCTRRSRAHKKSNRRDGAYPL
jgi:hypothetical protein